MALLPTTEIDEQPEINESECEIQGSRREVRSLIFHLLYTMEMYDYDVSLDFLIGTFNNNFDVDIEPDGEIANSAYAIIESRQFLDNYIQPLLSNWRLERIGVCTKLVLRLAIWELLNTKIDPKIIINEAIELAKCFSERDAYKFVNGILDEALKRQGISIEPAQS